MIPWTYDAALEQGVFPHEGGYTNHPSDPGGPTNWGITIIDARLYWKKDATAEDVRAMPKSVAASIYRLHYAKPLRYDDLPAGVDYAALDYGINSGVSRGAKVLQRLCGVTADGQIGPVTLAAVAKRDPVVLVNAMCDERLRFLKSLSTWPVFGKGWERRVVEVRALALDFARDTSHVPSPSIVPSQPGEMGKGVVPLNPAEKITIRNKGKVGAGTGVVAGGTAGTVWDWISAHPTASVVIGGCVVLVVAGAVVAIEQRYHAKQDAPTPGLVPVPVLP